MLLSDQTQVDWQSIQQQQEWFDKFKIVAKAGGGLIGLDLAQFRKFLNSSLYSYLTEVVIKNELTAADTQPQLQQELQSPNQPRQRIQFDADQEAQLFKHFDLKNDTILDQDEFALLCHNWLHKIYRRKSALVIVDVQNDFIDGSLALIKSAAGQDGAEVVPIINKLLESNLFDTVVYTQDWHPSDHIGFHDNLHLRKYIPKSSVVDGGSPQPENGRESVKHLDVNQNATSAITARNRGSNFCKLNKLSTNVKVFDTVLFDEGRMEQILWPRHCVQGSWGAELHPKLKVIQNSVRILKGTQSHVDSYSAFWDNLRLNETNLRDELTSRAITDVFFCGLAYDYCVAASALDSRKAGFMTYVIKDACKGIDNNSIEKMTNDMICNDILIVNTLSTCDYLTSTRNHVQLHDGTQRGNISEATNKKRDEVSVESASEGCGMRSDDDIGAVLKAACFKKAFLAGSA